ncbi:MerR family transcriptional regulator [Streptomyces sp. NPDC101455]|uniref:MerR family transcriptional regulator n=1 Tax=Streptomyces sp. NPDC101455 TaxID=3366142 RepID=UPI00380586CE
MEGQVGEGYAPVLIGELAKRTGTSERLLRYYERAGLLRPERLPNGYREYTDSDTAAVLRIRALLAAGLPTRVIRHVLPCTTDGAAVQPCPGVLDALRAQLSDLDRRAAELAAAREVLRDTIANAESRTAPTPA